MKAKSPHSLTAGVRYALTPRASDAVSVTVRRDCAQAFEAILESRAPGEVTLEDAASVFPYPMDAFQADAVKVNMAGDSVVVCAPTGAGKTAIAVACAVPVLVRGQRVVYTTPLKALSNQKLIELQACPLLCSSTLLCSSALLLRCAPPLCSSSAVLLHSALLLHSAVLLRCAPLLCSSSETVPPSVPNSSGRSRPDPQGSGLDRAVRPQARRSAFCASSQN